MAARKKSDPKAEALRESGTFNSRSEKVQDELFKSHDFFDVRDIIQVKYEMLRRVREDAWSISRAAAAYGFSRPSFYQAQAEFEHAGLVGLLPERRGPREAGRRLQRHERDHRAARGARGLRRVGIARPS